MKERVEQIIKLMRFQKEVGEDSPYYDFYELSYDDGDCLIDYIKQLEKENKELRKQLSELCPIDDLPVIDSLLVEKEHMKEYIKNLETAIRDSLARMEQGGAGTRSFVWNRLSEALEGW